MKNSLFFSTIISLGIFSLSCETKEKQKKTTLPHKVAAFTPIPTKSTIALAINSSALIDNIDALDFGSLTFVKKQWEQLKTIIDTNSRSYYYKKDEAHVICLATSSNQKAKSFIKDIRLPLPYNTLFGPFNLYLKNNYLHLGFNETKHLEYIPSNLFPKSKHTFTGFFTTKNDSLSIACTVKQLTKWSGSVTSGHTLFEPITNLEIDTASTCGALRLSYGLLKKIKTLFPKHPADYLNHINGVLSFAYSGIEADTITITKQVFNEEDFTYQNEQQKEINQYHKFSVQVQTKSKKETTLLKKHLIRDHIIVKRKKEYLATFTTTKTSFEFKDHQCKISNKKYPKKIDYSGLGFISINIRKTIPQSIQVPYMTISQSSWLTRHLKSLKINNLDTISFGFDIKLDSSSKKTEEIINLFLSANSL